MSNLEDLFRTVSERMKLDFEIASQTHRTPDDVAHDRQKIVMGFLKRYFPPTYQFGEGEIIDSNGNRSGQVDVVICNAYHPFTISESGVGLFFCEGVLCAIEVKSRLSDKIELERGLRQIVRVKELKREPIKGDLMFGSDFDQERLARIPAVLWGFQAPSLARLKSNIFQIYEKLRVPLEKQVDAVVVHDKGVIFNIKDTRDPLNIEVDGQRRLGLVGLDFGDRTLMCFLFHLSQILPREIRMAPIILLYTGLLEGEERVKVV